MVASKAILRGLPGPGLPVGGSIAGCRSAECDCHEPAPRRARRRPIFEGSDDCRERASTRNLFSEELQGSPFRSPWVGGSTDRDLEIIDLPGAKERHVSFGVFAARALENRQVDGFWANAMGAETAITRGCGKLLIDVRRGAYKKLVIAEGRLTGAVLIGDVTDALWYLELIRSREPVARIRKDMMFGRALALSAEAA